MAAPSYRPRSPYTGPPPVLDWRERKTASLCEMNRAGERLRGRHKELAEAEALLERVRKLDGKDRHPDAIANLEKRVANRRAWLAFSAATLDSIVRFAQARIDNDPTIGPNRKNEHLRKTARRRRRGVTNRRYHEQVRHWSKVVDSYKWALEATAGHSGSSQALLKLKDLCQGAIRKYVAESPREASDAEQMALLGILRAAEDYDPSHKKMAQFNTLAKNWIRRKTQVRRASACGPGKTLVKGKVRTVKSIEAERQNSDGESASVDLLHPATMGEDAGLSVDLARAFATLADDERAVAEHRLVQGLTFRQVAAELDLTKAQVERIFRRAQQKLQKALAAHAPQG